MVEYTKKVVRKPFIVDAMEITAENIADVAEFVGELTEEKGRVFIQVDRSKVQGVYKVFPGFWMTKMGDNIRCYSPKVFAEQFCDNTPDVENWVNYINELPANNVDQQAESAKDVIIQAAQELPQPEVTDG